MIKDHFMDAFLQISIILSLLKSDYQDVTLFNQLNTLRDSFNGQLAVSPIIDFHSINGRNPDLGFVHPKNARIEDVLRSVHSLGRFGRFRGISSDVVNAFLVDETPNAFSAGNGNGGNNAGRPSAGGDNTLPHSNSPLTQGEEPTKEDMDLIDVLWRHDIDLGVTVEPPLMWELEKEQEFNLHKRLEEEAIALVKLEDSQTSDDPICFDSCVQDATRTDAGECSTASEELNTPEILDNPGFSLFNEQNTQENIESDWANLMNLIGVENNLDGDVEGEMFSNLFAFNDDRDGDGDDDAVQVKMEGGEEESQLRGLENIDFPMFDDPLLGLDTDLDTLLGMEDLNIEFDGLPDLADAEEDSSSSILKRLSGGQHTPRSCLSTTDPSFSEMFSRDESIFSPSEGKYSTSDRVSSRCSFSSDSLLAGCTRSSSIWADSTDIHHNHTYDNKLHFALSQEPCFKEEKEHKKPTLTFTKDYFPKEKTTRPTRSRDEVKLKQMKIPFSLDEIINNPIEWFTDVTTNPKFRFSPQQVDLLRSIRKRGKNKEAAQNCRKRKLDEIQSLEMEVDALSARRIELAKSCGSLENNIDKLARKFTELQERILVSARRSNQKFGDGDMSLHFDRTGVIRLVEGSQCRQQQLDEWDSMTKTDNSNRKTAKTKRKQTKRN